jgi:hypothetical protein
LHNRLLKASSLELNVRAEGDWMIPNHSQLLRSHDDLWRFTEDTALADIGFDHSLGNVQHRLHDSMIHDPHKAVLLT